MKQERQKSALERLQNQLTIGKVGKKMDQPMTDTDRKRIEKEIEILKSRVGR